MSTIVENTNPVTVDIEPKYSVTTQSGAIVENKAPEYSVSVQRKEYKVVGDNIYIPRLYDDAPQWMKDLVNTVVDVKTAVAVGNLDDALEALRTLSDELDVAKNTYTNSIISSNDIDQRINTAIETLNSALSDADATIMNIAQTATTPAEASAIALNTLSASLSASGEIGSFISNMNSAFADLDSTTTQSINFMESAINAEFSANATALNTIRTYVGIDSDGNGTGTGLAEAITQLGVDISNEAGLRAAGDTTVTNTVKAYADSVGAGVESKWEYGSTLNVDGKDYVSGFGLVSNTTHGVIGAPASGSEFWISADKFKLSASGGKGSSYTPFSVNATTGDITFKGKVTFGSNQSGTIEEAIASTIETVQVGDKNINITDNLIPITILVGDTNNASYQFIGTPTKSNKAGIDTFAEPQILLDSSDEVYSPYVDEVTIPYYFRVGIKGITSLDIIKICTINLSNVVTYGILTYTMNNGESLDPLQWYIVDGIINPAGGNAAASGSIRKADGTKIGTINNYSIPSGALKILLGFVANCVISRIKLAKITADTLTGNYVTQDYVDNSVDTVSWETLKNKDSFAQKLGYSNYAKLELAAISGETIINGGYINTGLIQANAITANMINTNGLIAENISGATITGKVIDGSTINGSVINGAVVKTSYLDLDGDLEVLTDYHLSKTQAQLNAVIAAGGTGRLVLEADKVENGGDAVYTAADEYRIPTLSLVSEPIQNFTGSGIKTLVGKIFPYNSTRVNSNLKAKKIRPAISVAIESAIYSANDLGINGNLSYNGGGYPLLPDNPNFSNGNGTLVEIWFGGVLLIRFGSYYPYNITHRCYIYDALTKTYVDGGTYLTYSPSLIDKTLVLNTSTFDVKLHYIRAYSQSCDGEGCTSSRSGKITMSILPKTFTIPFDFTSGNLEIRSVYNSYNFNLKIPSGISINNMI